MTSVRDDDDCEQRRGTFNIRFLQLNCVRLNNQANQANQHHQDFLDHYIGFSRAFFLDHSFCMDGLELMGWDGMGWA